MLCFKVLFSFINLGSLQFLSPVIKKNNQQLHLRRVEKEEQKIIKLGGKNYTYVYLL